MIQAHTQTWQRLLGGHLGTRRFNLLTRTVELPAELGKRPSDGHVRAPELAWALALGLLSDLLDRVPLAAAYVAECEAAGRRFVFDHGAARTLALPSGDLPAGRRALTRLLEPLGYRPNRTYPLPDLGMVGHVYTHPDHPEALPQYFLSELDPSGFSPGFRRAMEELVATSVDPLPAWAADSLDELSRSGELAADPAARLLSVLATCFGRHHREPSLEEYERFAKESAEAAWIATEGHSFNHITDRVVDVFEVAEAQRRQGRPIKGDVERSRSGRVLQTAFRAAEVERIFRVPGGHVSRRVPGSFLEFISRSSLEDGRLDLAFDAQNAQGIFTMTNPETNR